MESMPPPSPTQAVGLDMDYTIAQYRPETFEVLAYNLTVDKLVSVFNYPKVRMLLGHALLQTWRLTCVTLSLNSSQVG